MCQIQAAMNRENKPPHAGNRLYFGLFQNRTEDEALTLLGEGLVSVKDNARRLVTDAQLLLKSKRFSSARFILTTADEEMAKAYILLDMCRLDFSRHESTLRCLCRAFYDHVSKHAYNEVHRFQRIHNMAHAREIWDVETTKWWPSNPESGEPDMPHDTYFLREMPLYVDYIEYDQRWLVPDDGSESFWFERSAGIDSLSVTLKYLAKLEFTYEIGLFDFKCLKIFNEGFKKFYIKENWQESDRIKIYTTITERLVREHSMAANDIVESIYNSWPLYSFLTIN